MATKLHPAPVTAPFQLFSDAEDLATQRASQCRLTDLFEEAQRHGRVLPPLPPVPPEPPSAGITMADPPVMRFVADAILPPSHFIGQLPSVVGTGTVERRYPRWWQ